VDDRTGPLPPVGAAADFEFSGVASAESLMTGDQRESTIIVFICPTCRLLMSDFETIDSPDGDWYATCCWRCGHRFGGGSRTHGMLDIGIEERSPESG